MTYRRGDVQTALGPLRLTVSALAEITERLDAPTPGDLADQIRALSPEHARHLLTALLRPSGAQERVTRLTNADIAGLMPAAALCITKALETG